MSSIAEFPTVTSYMQPVYAGTARFTTTANIGTSSVLVIAANAHRLGLLIYNNSTNAVYINFGAAANSTTAMCVVIEPNTTFEMLGPVVYTGQISGIRNPGATGTLLVTELMA